VEFHPCVLFFLWSAISPAQLCSVGAIFQALWCGMVLSKNIKTLYRLQFLCRISINRACHSVWSQDDWLCDSQQHQVKLGMKCCLMNYSFFFLSYIGQRTVIGPSFRILDPFFGVGGSQLLCNYSSWTCKCAQNWNWIWMQRNVPTIKIADLYKSALIREDTFDRNYVTFWMQYVSRAWLLLKMHLTEPIRQGFFYLTAHYEDASS